MRRPAWRWFRLCGVPLNAILITMVPLVYVTGISGAIHLTNYYLEAARHGSLPARRARAVAHAAVPLVLAAVTTALGLLSLCYSELNPIRLFGVFSAIGCRDWFAGAVHAVAGGAGGVDAAAAANQAQPAARGRSPRSWRCFRKWVRGCPGDPTLVAAVV